MRTVAIISEHASPLADLGGVDSGGQNVYVAHIARNLARLGYQVDIFTRRDSVSLPEVYNWTDGVRVIHVPAGPAEYVRKEELLGHMEAFSEYMIAFIRRQGKPYDLIHANFWMSGLVAADIKAALGIPFVVTFHALGYVRRQYQGKDDGFPDQRFEAEQRIVQEADGIIAECPQDRDDLLMYYSAERDRIREIPCGFDPHELWPINKRAAAREVGLSGNEWIVLQLGRMVPRKGVDTAICGFAEMQRRLRAPARMLVVGGASREPDPIITPEIGRLQSIAEEEGVLDQITFSGRRSREELKYYYSAADVFVSTPWYEPFGITPVEAMACGTPVIGARVGGIKHTVLDGETGYLVAPKDPQEIARKLIELYQDPVKQERFRQQAIRRVNDLFTWRKVTESLAIFYEDVLVDHKLQLVSQSYSRGLYASEDRTEDDAAVARNFDSALRTVQRSKDVLAAPTIEAARLLSDCLNRGGKVMVCGNGGSAADAQHFAAELLGRFVLADRRALPVISLTADSAFMTAWSNDMGYQHVFSRQLEALGQPGDVLVGISTSGRSQNVVKAFQRAQELGVRTIALLGGDGGNLLHMADAVVVVPSWSTQRIQEIHTIVMHALCELVEKHVASDPSQTPLPLNQASMVLSSTSSR
jgi:D-inositol-3-phosphate glycosyltransferase